MLPKAQALQRRAVEKVKHAARAGNSWDVAAALADSPRGAYFALMDPIVEATLLAYNVSSGPDHVSGMDDASIRTQFSGSRAWKRRRDLELNPAYSGVHMLVFVNNTVKQAIVAFRGSCSSLASQCRADKCYLSHAEVFGVYTPFLVGTDLSLGCDDFSESDLDYVQQADSAVRRVQKTLPGFSLLLTGHSLGAHLAIVTAAQQPGVLKAVGLSPSPFHKVMTETMGFSDEQMDTLPVNDLVSIGAPFDIRYNTLEVPDARLGSLTCLVEDDTEPPECASVHDALTDGMQGAEPFTTFPCKMATHSAIRYEIVLKERGADGAAPANPLTCSTEYSTLQSLFQRKRVARSRK